MDGNGDIFRTVGGFGRYQIVFCLIVFLNSFFGTDLLYCNYLLYTPEHWCKADFLNGWNNLSVTEIRNLTIPWDEDANEYRWVLFQIVNCALVIHWA